MLSHTTNIRIRYAETDQMNVVYYSNYFVYFETGRTELFRSIGLPYSKIEKMGYILPVVEAYAKYYKSVAYDDVIHVITKINEIQSAKVKLEYEIREAETKDLIAEGFTVHIFLNSKTRKINRAPEIFSNTIQKAFDKNI